MYTSARVLRQVLQARMLGWKRRQRAKERDWPPVGPPLIVGVKIESVSQTWVLVQRTGQASPIQKGRNRQSTAAVGARFWNRQERAWQRRTSTHRKHRRTVIVDSDQLRATGTGSRLGEARAIGGEMRKTGYGHATQGRPAQNLKCERKRRGGTERPAAT